MSFTKFTQQFKTFNDKLYHVFQIAARDVGKNKWCKRWEGLITSLKWEEYFLSLPVLQNNTTFRLSLIVVKKTHFLCFSGTKVDWWLANKKVILSSLYFFLPFGFVFVCVVDILKFQVLGFWKEEFHWFMRVFFYYYILIESINGTE